MKGKTIILILLRFFVTVIIWIPIAFFLVVLINFINIGTLGICDDMSGAKVWLDVNGNGIEDSGEPPFSGACLWAHTYPDSSSDISGEPICNDKSDYSDENGLWSQMHSCGSDIFVSIMPPAGYKLSTVPIVESKDQLIVFGLVPESIIVLNGIKEWDYYAKPLQESQSLKNNIKLSLFICLLLASVLVSLFTAKRIFK